MNVNSVGNSLGWSGVGKTGNGIARTGGFASSLSVANKKKNSLDKNNLVDSTSKVNGLSDDDYKELALKFNPKDMALSDYNSFLDYLQSKGVISDDEKKRVGYNGTVVKQVNGMVGAYYSEEPIVDNFIDGNVLAFTRSQGSLIYSESIPFNEETKGLYRKITAIFERMLQEKNSN